MPFRSPAGVAYGDGVGSVVILEPGGPHTGGPAGPGGFVYRVMYPSADLLADRADRPPRFLEPVVADPGLALELRHGPGDAGHRLAHPAGRPVGTIGRSPAAASAAGWPASGMRGWR